jgi:hypothetical protein
VRVFAGGIEYEPLIQGAGSISNGFARCVVVYSLAEIVDGTADNINGKMPTVIYADDFRLLISGEFAKDWVYYLYDSDLEEICLPNCNSTEHNSHVNYHTCGVYDTLEFIMPEEAGVYYLKLHMIWENDGEGIDFAQSSVVYYFKIVRVGASEPPRPPTFEEELAEFVQLVSGPMILMQLPFFTDINNMGDESLIAIMWHYLRENYDWDNIAGFSAVEGQHDYTFEEAEALLGSERWGGRTHGVSPALLNAFVRERFNPNFSIENYNYKNLPNSDGWEPFLVWDAARKLIVFSVSVGCGWSGGVTNVADISEVDGTYIVYATRVFAWGWDEIHNVEFVRYTVAHNADGQFNIISKQLADDSVTPAWILEFRDYREKLRNDCDYAYSRIMEVLDFTPNYGEWCEECRNASRTLCDDHILNFSHRVLTEKFRSYLGWYYND